MAAVLTLIIVPRRCYTPPALEGSGRVWGPALQLYALRSGRNWGVGDFTDLRRAVEFAGRFWERQGWRPLPDPTAALTAKVAGYGEHATYMVREFD